MNDRKKYLSTCLLATATLLVGASPAWAQVSLGTASTYSVLGSPVSTTSSTIAGDVGSAGALTLTSTAVTGNVVYSGALTVTPPSTVSGTSTTPLPTQVVTDFNSAYAAARSMHCRPYLAWCDHRPHDAGSRCLLHERGIDGGGRVDPGRGWQPQRGLGFPDRGSPHRHRLFRW